MKEAEDVIETCSQLDTEHSALGAMLVVLSIGEYVQFQDGEAFSRQPQYVLIKTEGRSVAARI